jgi:hypothetical protein
MRSINIATLTHAAPGRALMLKHTIQSFLQNTPYGRMHLDWHIVINGDCPQTRHILEEIKTTSQSRFNTNFIFTSNPDNIGVGAGINQLNAMSRGYEYTLFLEGDWLCLHAADSGYGYGYTDWLEDCLSAMEIDTELDCMYLRRFASPTDSRMTGLQGYYMHTCIKKAANYFVCKMPCYTNNPLIRRNSAFYKKGIFPLQEFYSPEGEPLEIKGNPEWGRAEIAACSHLGHTEQVIVTGFLNKGIFLHLENTQGCYDLTSYRIKPTPHPSCDVYTMGATGCKYGYFVLDQPHFCALCPDDTVNTVDVWRNFQHESDFLNELDGIQKSEEAIEALIKKYNPGYLRCPKQMARKLC